MIVDPRFCDRLSELIICCDLDALVAYANPAAQEHARCQLLGQPFLSLLNSDGAQKGSRFLDAVRTATVDEPTSPWELPLGDDPLHYKVGSFSGYRQGDELLLIGQVEASEMSEMQRELLALTSELSEAQREQRRQNRQLQQTLDEQRRLMETIQDLTVPALPIWERVLMLPLVGHLDSRRAEQVTSGLLERVATYGAEHAIIDLSGIGLVDTAVAQQLIRAAQALKLLGVQPILVGINPEIAQTIVNLGVQLPGFLMQRDLRHALTYVLARTGGRRVETTPNK